MLALSKLPDFTRLRFPILVSPKLDGVRASMQGGQLLSRSLKPIPNKFVQALFKGLPEGCDGELIHGDPWDDPYRRTVSVVMSDDKPCDGVKLYIFDLYTSHLPFHVRFHSIKSSVENYPEWKEIPVSIVPHHEVNTVEEIEACEQEFLSRGYEGLMLRDPEGPYKQGRSSEREGWLMKVKRYEDAEARVLSCYEEMENTNEAFKNELGRTARSSAKAGKIGKNQLGGFHCRGVGGRYDSVEFDISSSAINHVDRQAWWKRQEDFIGKLVTYKFFPTGGDTRPRHPIFKGLRDARDL